MIEIYFVEDRKDLAYKRWPSAPRIGERVLMHFKEGAVPYIVDMVTWGAREVEERGHVTCNVKIVPASK